MIARLVVAIACLWTPAVEAARAIDAELSQQVWAEVRLASSESVWMLVDACTNEESAPAILVTAPPDNAVVHEQEQLVMIRWRSCGHVPYVKLELVHKHDVVLLIDAGTKNDGVYGWSVRAQALAMQALPLQDFYKVRVSSLHDASVSAETQGSFRIVRTIPHENEKELHFLHDKFDADLIP